MAGNTKELFARNSYVRLESSKRENNLRDHGIDFKDARFVIDGDTAIRRSDRKNEVRYMVFGFLDDLEVVVACTLRG